MPNKKQVKRKIENPMAKRCSGIDHHGFSYLQFLVAIHHLAHQHSAAYQSKKKKNKYNLQCGPKYPIVHMIKLIIRHHHDITLPLPVVTRGPHGKEPSVNSPRKCV